MPFEKIEEQAREESPIKSQRTKADMTLARAINPIKQVQYAESSEPITDWSLYDLHYPREYHNDNSKNITVKNEVMGNDGKVQKIYENNKKEVVFSNKVRRETFPDGYTIVYFNNGDIKQTFPDQKVVYFFSEAQTTQTTFAGGM
jgi:hypothetical protein